MYTSCVLYVYTPSLNTHVTSVKSTSVCQLLCTCGGGSSNSGRAVSSFHLLHWFGSLLVAAAPPWREQTGDQRLDIGWAIKVSLVEIHGPLQGSSASLHWFAVQVNIVSP